MAESISRNCFLTPNVEEFLGGLLQLIYQCDDCIQENVDGGMAEFLGRRLEEYRRTLRIMYGRIRQHRPLSTHLTEDIEQLLNYVSDRTEKLQGLYNDDHNRDMSQEVFSRVEGNLALCSPVQSNNVGRPSFNIQQEQIEGLHTVGFRWADIARILGVSARTLNRRRQEFAMPVGQQYNFSPISDVELDSCIREILTITPQSGQGFVQGALRSRGLTVQRHRVIEALHRLDPMTSALRQSRRIVRRTYSVPGPNSLWHIDGDHKLIEPYRFVIHGGIDGYSRLIVFLSASTNNRADTVFDLFREATARYNIPSRVRSDMGLENIDVARFMIQARGTNRGSIITGSSVHNQRIERLWREVNRVVVSRFRNIFLFLENTGAFDPNNEVHLYCLHIVYLPLLNGALCELCQQWNDHPVTTESNYSPRQMWMQGMLQLRHSSLPAVRNVIDGETVPLENFGIEEGQGPNIDGVNALVTVPESSVQLSEAQLEIFHQAIARIPLDDNGIRAYNAALSAIGAILL